MQIARGPGSGTQQFDNEMMKRTVAKCGGLPKVIAAIGECTNGDLLEGFSDEFMRILETGQPRIPYLKGPIFLDAVLLR